MMHRAVVFDAVGTLIHPEPDVLSVYQHVGQRHGSRLDASTIKSRFKAAFAREDAIDRANDWRTDEPRERCRWRDIVAAVFDDADADACFADLFAHFARPDSWRLDAAAGALFATLRDQRQTIALASNFDARLHAIAAGLSIDVDHIVISSELGVRKPARPFFDAIIQRLGVAAHEIAFIGDDPINDAAGAAAAGMTSFLLGRNLRSLAEIVDRRI